MKSKTKMLVPMDHQRDLAVETMFGEQIRVSTVGLLVDHSFGRSEPQLYETMVSRGYSDESTWEWAEFQQRYATREEALRGHHELVQRLEKL